MSEAPFRTLDELIGEFPHLKRAKRLHPLVERRLAALLEDIWPDAYAKPEPGEIPAGRSDLGFYFADGRYAVFEIFASVSQVPQDLRHLEQSNAKARIAILTDPLLDNGAIYREYYGKKARDPFPAVNLSDILVQGNKGAAKQKLQEYIEEAFASPEDAAEQSERVRSRLAELALDDESRDDFGESSFTSGVSRPDCRYVILAAIPLRAVSHSGTNVLLAARTMLEPGHWYSPNPDDPPPRYWPPAVFKVPVRRRSAQNALFWEDPDHAGTSAAASRLVVTDRAEVLFVSGEQLYFVTKVDSVGVFMLGRILAECWKLSGMVAQLYHDLEHSGRTELCIAMVGTEGTYLGGFAGRYVEPCDPSYWPQAMSPEHPWTCHAPNLRLRETVDVFAMKPKEQPAFISDFAWGISVAYNHQEPRCFDRQTGCIPGHYFDRY